MNTTAVLTVEQLSKTYKTFKKDPGLKGSLKALFARQEVEVAAVRAVTFNIARGEFVGLLGPNGAGKTTTLKMLTGLIRPTAGRAVAFGTFDTAARTPAYLRRIGMVMGQRNQLNPDLPASDSFRLAQAIYGLDDARVEQRLKLCIDLFGVEGKISVPVRKLSLGERMKMELILAILHEPDLLFLDEPTIGLDFNAARQIREFLAEANRKLGITVVMTSHYTKDIEELCRRVVLINNGQIVHDGTLAAVDERIQGQKNVALMLVDAATKAAAQKAVDALAREGLLSTTAVSDDDTSKDHPVYQISFDVKVRQAAAVTAKVLDKVGAAQVIDIKVVERPLDEIFGEIYRKG